MNISQKIINWYKINKRDLPWRNTKDPYKIWVSEIILQQTRVEQGLNYYLRFIENFPNVQSLAKADEDKVLKLWQGLGYYSRARNLHFSAKYIVNELNGEFPTTFIELRKLKGVGDYTAAAIASFAFNEKVAVVDGNVYRLLSRLFAEKTPIDSTIGKRLFFEMAKKLLEAQEAQIFNQAIMEFGALQCKPTNPDCVSCPLQRNCLAFSRNIVLGFPVKSKKVKVTKRFFHYFHIEHRNGIYIQKRSDKDIWKGLFEFPLIETKTEVSFATLAQSKEWHAFFGEISVSILGQSEIIKHQLSHQQLQVSFYKLRITKKASEKSKLSGFLFVPFSEIGKYAIPKVIENYLSNSI